MNLKWFVKGFVYRMQGKDPNGIRSWWIQRFMNEDFQRQMWRDSRDPHSPQQPTMFGWMSVGRWPPEDGVIGFDYSPTRPVPLEWSDFIEVAKKDNLELLEQFLHSGWVPNENYEKPIIKDLEILTKMWTPFEPPLTS